MNLSKKIPKIELYSDGGADPNPGKGGYGVILSWKGHRKEFSEGFELTTNNRMELLGVISGLKKLKTKSEVEVYTDSKYVADAIEKGWAKKWKENNWFRNKKEKAINIDLWEELLPLLEKHQVKFFWVKGHNGHPENERCDQLATQALNSDNLKKDIAYEEFLKSGNPTGKIEKEGDLCRKCNTPVVKRMSNPKRKKSKQSYYFEYYMLCPNCKAMYMVEEAKREIDDSKDPSLF
ncbi:ribonuclease HI [Marinifilum fragile]|uniref:ribonuclease HI n=1 Tax=Marinifilum fragile TaxID=570161 RepID=UPI002AA66034|nr:ribonuclease HI [Marinifilum fragile]